MSPDGRSVTVRVVVAAAAILACVGIATLPPATPLFVRSVADDAGLAARTGLTRASALTTAEQVRASVLEGDPGLLPAAVDGRPGFDERARNHLGDVRSVLRGALLATVIAAAVAVVAAWWGMRTGRSGDVSSGLRIAGWTLIVTVPVLGAASFAAPEALFTWFHGLFFEPGTWLFAEGDLLIALFPPTYWALSAAAWGLGVVVGGACLLGASRLVRVSTAYARAEEV